MNGELTGRVALIPPTRPGWEEAEQDIPCLVGRFCHGGGGCTYYEVDSPYLAHHMPALAAVLGASWRWDAHDLSKQTAREMHIGDIPTEVSLQHPFRRIVKSVVVRLTRDHPATIAMRMSRITKHPLVYESKELMADAFRNAPEELANTARLAQGKMQHQLLTPATRLLFELLHKQTLNELAAIGVKMRNKLKFELPRTHKADKTEQVDMFCRPRVTSLVSLTHVTHTSCILTARSHCAQESAPFIGRIEHDVDIEVGALLPRLLKAAGFTKGDCGVFSNDGMPDAVRRLFGEETTRGGFNPLLKVDFFLPRVVTQHELFEPGMIPSPSNATDNIIYAHAQHELGDEAFGSDKKHKPEWLLRKLMVNKMIASVDDSHGWGGAHDVEWDPEQAPAYDGKPDWRVRGIACVLVHKPFEVGIRNIITRVDGEVAAERSLITVKFVWQGRHRKTPGKTHMRIVFPSLIPPSRRLVSSGET